MKVFIKITLVIFVGITAACGREGGLEEGALGAKEEFSILQHFEYEYRTRGNSDPVVIQQRALGSDYDVIGLPKKGGAEGYVWFIADADTRPSVKQMSEGDAFVITEAALRRIERSVRLSRDLKEYFSRALEGDG